MPAKAALPSACNIVLGLASSHEGAYCALSLAAIASISSKFF